jgi:hypothetical protein
MAKSLREENSSFEELIRDTSTKRAALPVRAAAAITCPEVLKKLRLDFMEPGLVSSKLLFIV